MTRKIACGILAAAALLSACGKPAPNDDTARALAALQDRAAVEDLLQEYYRHLGSGAHEGFDTFFTEDALLDVNGFIAQGHKAIQGLYDRAGGSEKPAAVPPEKMHMDYMHLTNPLVRIDGDTATASMFWTGVVSNDLNAPPEFEEMGREYDLLVKKDGKWKIKKRIIVADAGMPKSMNKTYKRRLNYDVLKGD